MANHLVNEKSPYLLQHAHNPVDWYPWGEETFKKAERESKPIFLSIGYATCHWCHVMAHESFEDEEVARILNKNYISIKVDREERPDVDQVYMTACQALTGQGGWPLSVFMTPEGKPFFVGTYFPKTSRFGRPGLIGLLTMLADKWRSENEIVRKSADQLTQTLQSPTDIDGCGSIPGPETMRLCYQQLSSSFDSRSGGFGRAPKFPTPANLNFLLRQHHREGDSRPLEMVEKTLAAMRWGGLFDQIGFGFHRYAVDAQWLVPHFEKMLYDQALLALAYTEAFQVTGRALYARVTNEIFTYVLRDMTSPEGGFYAAEDADSEGHEGRFYVWKPQEVKETLGLDLGELFCRFHDITPAGNFEAGFSIPHVSTPVKAFAEREGLKPADLEIRLEEARRILFARREKRVHPFKDDKILTAWNGLMIAALAKGSQALDRPEYAEAAVRAFDFISARLMKRNGRLMRRYRQGEAAYQGYLDDYAFLVWGLIELYETTFEVRFLEQALTINRVMLELFWDNDKGGLFFTGRDNEPLVARQKDVNDGAMPSGNSVAALNLLRLGRMTGDTRLENRADELVRAFAGPVNDYPMAHAHFLMALDFMSGSGSEIIIAGDPSNEAVRAMAQAVRKRFLPGKVLLLRPGGEDGRGLAVLAPFTEAMRPQDGRPTAYLCQGYACRRPLTNQADLEEALNFETKNRVRQNRQQRSEILQHQT